LRDALETAVHRQVAHGLYRAGLTGLGPPPVARNTRRDARAHRRRANLR
jgi:hypothetical protein